MVDYRELIIIESLKRFEEGAREYIRAGHVYIGIGLAFFSPEDRENIVVKSIATASLIMSTKWN